MNRAEHLIHRNERWMYAGRRPNRLARLLNRAWATVGTAGLWPGRLVTLEVRGRQSGRPMSVPLIVAELDGRRYLVSMLGERASWVANVRAAGGSAVIRRGRREQVRLDEVDPDERAPIIRRHMQVAPAARSFVPFDWRAPLPEYERIAGTVPVFRIRPAGDADRESTAGASR